MLEWLYNFVGPEWAGIIVYILIFVGAAFVYNRVFRTNRPPLLKNILVYLLIAAGSSGLWLLQMLGLPIVEAMAVAILLMVIFRVRQYAEKQAAKREES